MLVDPSAQRRAAAAPTGDVTKNTTTAKKAVALPAGCGANDRIADIDRLVADLFALCSLMLLLAVFSTHVVIRVVV